MMIRKYFSVSFILFIVLLFCGVGCANYRLVVEPYDRNQALHETTVFTDDGASKSSGDKVAMISYTGLIAMGRRPSLLGKGRNPVSDFVEALEKARKDDRVKAIILSINSPGGTVTASDIMYQQVRRFKEKSKKPVVVLMGEVAASGGYYLSCAGDEIIARPTTITGSIGVIIETINFSEGLAKIGIHARSVTSGPNKSMGSPFEPEKPEHRKIMQGMVDEFYARFVDIVKKNRPNLAQDDLPKATDGRVVTGHHALELGLVDAVGYLPDAFSAAKRLAHLDRARLVKYHRPGEFVPTAYAESTVSADAKSLSSTGDSSGSVMNVNLLQFNAFNGMSGSMTPPVGPTAYYLWSSDIGE